MAKYYPTAMHKKSHQMVINNQQLIPESDIHLRKFNAAAQPLAELADLDLYDIEAIKFSDSGSQGVILVETARGAVVLKMSNQVGVEMFLNKLSQELLIPVPQMRYMNCIEMQKIKEQLITAASNDEVLSYRLKPKLKLAYIEIIQYIPSLALPYLPGRNVDVIFTDQRLQQLGKIYAFDIFIVNGDRYPLPVWRSEGNVDNIILRITGVKDEDEMMNVNSQNIAYEDFLAIDPMMILLSITNSKFQDNIILKYYEDVQVFLNSLCMDLRRNECACLHKLQQFVYANAYYELTGHHLRQIMIGLLLHVQYISKFDMGRFQQLLDQTMIPEDTDWLGTFNENLKRIHPEIHTKILSIFQQIVADNHDLIQQILSY